MKFLPAFVTSATLGLVLLSSCAPDPNTEQQVTITLAVSPKTLNLTKPSDTLGTSVNLSCGCDFVLVFTPLSGDTTKIQYAGAPAFNVSATPHFVNFFAPAATPKGAYTASYDIAVFEDHAGKYLHDTVVVNLNVP